jgi:hypothetical protein
MNSNFGLAGTLLLLLLLLSRLLDSRYLFPHKVARLPHHVYHFALSWGIELQVILHLSNVGQSDR